jgi:hypothetical protein
MYSGIPASRPIRHDQFIKDLAKRVQEFESDHRLQNRPPARFASIGGNCHAEEEAWSEKTARAN